MIALGIIAVGAVAVLRAAEVTLIAHAALCHGADAPFDGKNENCESAVHDDDDAENKDEGVEEFLRKSEDVGCDVRRPAENQPRAHR